jgi:hypothetical protein
MDFCALAQMLGDWFTGPADVGLREVDEPEKAKKLRKTLMLFMQARALPHSRHRHDARYDSRACKTILGVAAVCCL